MRSRISLLLQALGVVGAGIVFLIARVYFGLSHSYGIGHGNDHPAWHHDIIPLILAAVTFISFILLAWKVEFMDKNND